MNIKQFRIVLVAYIAGVAALFTASFFLFRGCGAENLLALRWATVISIIAAIGFGTSVYCLWYSIRLGDMEKRLELAEVKRQEAALSKTKELFEKN